MERIELSVEEEVEGVELSVEEGVENDYPLVYLSLTFSSMFCVIFYLIFHDLCNFLWCFVHIYLK